LPSWPLARAFAGTPRPSLGEVYVHIIGERGLAV
jgi:hypothetical protein